MQGPARTDGLPRQQAHLPACFSSNHTGPAGTSPQHRSNGPAASRQAISSRCFTPSRIILSLFFFGMPTCIVLLFFPMQRNGHGFLQPVPRMLAAWSSPAITLLQSTTHQRLSIALHQATFSCTSPACSSSHLSSRIHCRPAQPPRCRHATAPVTSLAQCSSMPVSSMQQSRQLPYANCMSAANPRSPCWHLVFHMPSLAINSQKEERIGAGQF